DFSLEEATNGNTVTLDSAAFVEFLQARADDNGLATILLTMPSQGAGNDRSNVYASRTHPDPALRPSLEIVYFDASLPSPPENLAVTDIDFAIDPTVQLAWDPVTDANFYTV